MDRSIMAGYSGRGLGDVDVLLPDPRDRPHTHHTGDVSVPGWRRDLWCDLSEGTTFLAIGGWHVIDHCQPRSGELETRQNTCHRIQSAQCDNRKTIALSNDRGTLSDGTSL